MKAFASSLLIQLVACLCFLALMGCGDSTKGTEPDRASLGKNSAPEILSINLSPQPALTNNNITVRVKAKDPDGDRIQYTYRWEVNREILEEETTKTLSSPFFEKGDQIAVTVTASDGKNEGDPVTSDPVAIQNSPPVITFATIIPILAHTKDRLTAVVKVQDVDEDHIAYSYQWMKNGEEIQDETSEVLEGINFAKGDVITLKVSPFDDETEGGLVTSLPVTVRNSPPLFTSIPSPSLNDEDVYIYHVSAEDPDEDSISYSLTTAPDNMTIDTDSGKIQWNVTQKDVGIHPVEVVVTDIDSAETIQRYDLHIFDLQKSGGSVTDKR